MLIDTVGVYHRHLGHLRRLTVITVSHIIFIIFETKVD